MSSQGQSSRPSSHIPSSPEIQYPSSRQSSISSRPSKLTFHERIMVNPENHSVDDTRNRQYSQSPPDIVHIEMDRLDRPLSREAPGDTQRTHQEKELARKKSQYYEDTFATRPSQSSARERVLRETVVLAEITTNVTIDDEYTFITDLSYNLSNRYQRSESSIFCTMKHSTLLIFEGSFDPAYVLTITAHPSQLQPVTNKRNAMMLAKGMTEALRVPPNRGLIRFVPVADECYAIGGKTVAAEIEELERKDIEWKTGRRSKNIVEKEPAPIKARRKSSLTALRSLSIRKKALVPPPLSTQHEEDEDKPQGNISPPASPRKPPREDGLRDLDLGAEQKLKNRKSFAAMLFGL